jgi:iron-sulfur cluster assembly accessory protein
MSDTVFPPFRVTPAAILQLEALGGTVRIDVETGGCCGNTYVFSLEPGGPLDFVYGCPGAELVVSDRAASLLPSATLDYNARIKPPRFRVIGNPNTPNRCPCNRSFGTQWPGKRQEDCRSRCVMPWDAPEP